MPAESHDQLAEIAERLAAVLRRQDDLGARIARIEAAMGVEAPKAVTQAPIAAVLGEARATTAAPGAAPAAANAPALSAARATSAGPAPTFEARVGLQWLNRVGVLTVLLGVAFGFKTAVDNGWIGPAARIALGVAVGLISLGVGERQGRRQHRVFAQGLTGLGIALFYLSGWAAFALYGLVPQPVAFALMVATTGAAALLAMRYHAPAIAVVGLLGGYATPIALATGAPHSLFFLAYLTVLDAGAIALARRRVWPIVETVTTLATVVAFGGWLAVAMTSDDRALATVFTGVFYVQLALARSRAPWYVAQLAAPFVVVGVWATASAELRVALLVATALAGVVVAARRQASSAAAWTALWFWLAELACAALVPAPLAIELAGAMVAFAAMLGWVVWAQRRGALGAVGLVLVLANPAALLVTAGVAALDPVWLGALGGALVALHIALARALRATPAGRLVGLAAHLLALAALAIELVTWIDRGVGEAARGSAITVASTVLLASYGVLAVVLGVVRRRTRDRVLGLALLALAVAKLYALDVWALGHGFQVAAFLALGALLLAVSYLYSRGVLGRLWSDARSGSA